MTLILIATYLLVVVALDILAYKSFHSRWKRRERARTTVGVVLVMVPGAVLALAVNLSGLAVWATIFCGFGVAGATTVYLDIQTETSQADDIRQGIFGNE